MFVFVHVFARIVCCKEFLKEKEEKRALEMKIKAMQVCSHVCVCIVCCKEFLKEKEEKHALEMKIRACRCICGRVCMHFVHTMCAY